MLYWSTVDEDDRGGYCVNASLGRQNITEGVCLIGHLKLNLSGLCVKLYSMRSFAPRYVDQGLVYTERYSWTTTGSILQYQPIAGAFAGSHSEPRPPSQCKRSRKPQT